MDKALEAAKAAAAAEETAKTAKEQIFAALDEYTDERRKKRKERDTAEATKDAVRTLSKKSRSDIEKRDREQRHELCELVRIVAEYYHLERDDDNGVQWTAEAAEDLAQQLKKYDAGELDAPTAARLRHRALTHRAARWVRGEVDDLAEAQLIDGAVPFFDRKTAPRIAPLLEQTATQIAALKPAQILAITAKSGQGKSQFTNILTASLLGVETPFFKPQQTAQTQRVLLVDTEQDDEQICRRLDMLERMGVPLDLLDVVALTDCSIERRKAYLYHLIEQGTSYSAVIFDGLKDFVTDFNDNAVCYELVSILTAWAKLTNTAVVCCLHLNKGAQGGGLMGAAKGHIGAALTEKASVVYVLEKKQINGTEVFTATLEKNRNGRTGDDVSLRWTYDGEQYTPYSEEEGETKIERVFTLDVLTSSGLKFGVDYKLREIYDRLKCNRADVEKMVDNGLMKQGKSTTFHLAEK